MGRFGAVLASTVAFAFGLLTTLGLLIDGLGPLSPLLQTFNLPTMTEAVLRIVTMTVAVSILIGVANLFIVHVGRVVRLRGGWPFSIVLLLSTLLVIGVTVAERTGALSNDTASRVLLESVQISVESALAGLIGFALVYGASRLMRQRVRPGSVIFVVAVIFALITQAGFGEGLAALLAIPLSAGARGILLGVALATVVSAIRALTGQDRSYRE